MPFWDDHIALDIDSDKCLPIDSSVRFSILCSFLEALDLETVQQKLLQRHADYVREGTNALGKPSALL